MNNFKVNLMDPYGPFKILTSFPLKHYLFVHPQNKITHLPLLQVDDLLGLKCISRVTRCLYILALIASKDFAYHGPRLTSLTTVKEKKLSVPGVMTKSNYPLESTHLKVLRV